MVCETCIKFYQRSSKFGLSQSSGDKERIVYSYGTDTDLQSSTDTNRWHMLLVDLENLQTTVASGQYDRVLMEVTRTKANLLLVEGKALNAKADTLDEMGKRDAIGKAYEAASASIDFFRSLPEEQKDKVMYAEALLLYANTAARVAKHRQTQAGWMKVSSAEMLDMARRNADEAGKILKQLDHPNAGNAYRVKGVIELSQKDFQQARKYFVMALQEFSKSEEGCKTVWRAVSFWSMHVALLEAGKKEESLLWLKQAIILHTEIEGGDHPYTKGYQDRLNKLTNNKYKDFQDFRLSSEETAVIKAALSSNVSL